MTTMHSRRARFALLFGLSATEMMPIALLAQALPIYLRRSGASLQAIGLISMVLLPRALKLLWAPLVDKLGARSKFGRYRGWVLLMHTLLVVTLVLGSFTDVPALLTTNKTVGVPALLWLSILSATADTASHALAVNLLRPEERGAGNGLQTAGAMLGSLAGGGLVVLLVERYGWQPALLTMAVCVLLPLPGVFLYEERPVTAGKHVSVRELFAVLKRPRMLHWLALLGALAIGPTMIDICLPTLLVDRGFALTEIGLVMGVMTSLFGAAGGAFGGFVVRRFGRERALYALTILCAFTVASPLVTRFVDSRALLYVALGIPYFGVVARAPLIYAMIMDRCRGHVASTDYTFQVTVFQVVGFLGLGLGGVVADHLGMTTVFALAAMLSLATLLAAKQLLQGSDFEAEQHHDPEPPLAAA